MCQAESICVKLCQFESEFCVRSLSPHICAVPVFINAKKLNTWERSEQEPAVASPARPVV